MYLWLLKYHAKSGESKNAGQSIVQCIYINKKLTWITFLFFYIYFYKHISFPTCMMKLFKVLRIIVHFTLDGRWNWNTFSQERKTNNHYLWSSWWNVVQQAIWYWRHNAGMKKQSDWITQFMNIFINSLVTF